MCYVIHICSLYFCVYVRVCMRECVRMYMRVYVRKHAISVYDYAF